MRAPSLSRSRVTSACSCFDAASSASRWYVSMCCCSASVGDAEAASERATAACASTCFS